MKLSNAIATGRVLLRARAGIFVAGNSGCALGMAYKAIGLARDKITGYTMDDCYRAWPWTMQIVTKPLCDCAIGDHNIGQAITHLFDTHVMNPAEWPTEWKVKAWTLDQLIDWVRSVEPAEDAPGSDGALATTEAHVEVCEKELTAVTHGHKT